MIPIKLYVGRKKEIPYKEDDVEDIGARVGYAVI
jgi:hypothetical protein